MNTSAIVMMVVAMAIIWGGLVVAILNLRRSKEEPWEDRPVRDL